jgi:hypothetical protein
MWPVPVDRPSIPADSPAAAAPPALRTLAWSAFWIRVAAAVILHFAVAEAALAPDQTTYHFGGSQLALYWQGERDTVPTVAQNAPPGYYYILATIYSVIGPYSLVPKLVNCILGALLVLLVHRLGLQIAGDPRVALRAAQYTAYFPSLILWSVLNLRDIWIVTILVFVTVQAMSLQDRFRLRTFVLLLGGLVVLPEFRSYVFVPVAVPLLASFIIRRRRNIGRNILVAGILVGVAIYLNLGGSGARFMDLATLQEYRYHTGFGGSQVAPEADITTAQKALSFLPFGVATFLLAPFPWNVRNLLQASTQPEMLFFYSLIPAMIAGIAAVLRHRLADSLMILMVVGGLTLGYSLGQANVGTAYRYRAQVLPFLLTFAALGKELRRNRSRVLTALTGPGRFSPEVARFST